MLICILKICLFDCILCLCKWLFLPDPPPRIIIKKKKKKKKKKRFRANHYCSITCPPHPRQKWWPFFASVFFCLSACSAGKWGPFFFFGGGGGGGGGLSAQNFSAPPPPTKTQGPPVPPHWKNPSYATVLSVRFQDIICIMLNLAIQGCLKITRLMFNQPHYNLNLHHVIFYSFSFFFLFIRMYRYNISRIQEVEKLVYKLFEMKLNIHGFTCNHVPQNASITNTLL